MANIGKMGWLLVLSGLMYVVSGRLADTERLSSVSCSQQNFTHPFHGNLACTRVCPPVRSKDVNVRFCSINCNGMFSHRNASKWLQYRVCRKNKPVLLGFLLIFQQRLKISRLNLSKLLNVEVYTSALSFVQTYPYLKLADHIQLSSRQPIFHSFRICFRMFVYE